MRHPIGHLSGNKHTGMAAKARRRAPFSTSRRKTISIVLPVYNEEGNIGELYRRLKSVLQTCRYDHELVFVNDGSKDRSLPLIKELAAGDPRVKYISLSRNFGHQIALTAGLDHACGDAVISMDSDLQHPPEMIPELLRHWEEGFQVVYTIRRKTEAISLSKRVTAGIFYWLINSLLQVQIEQNTSDFRLLDRRVCDALKQNREHARFFRGMIPWLGFRQKGVEFDACRRLAGRPGYTFSKMLRFAIDGILSYSYLPVYSVLIFSLLLAAAAMVYSLLVLYQKFVSGEAIPGQTSILIVALYIGSAQLLATCIACVYAYKSYNEAKGRPLYVIDEKGGIE